MDYKRRDISLIIGDLKANYERAMALKQELVCSDNTICFKVKDFREQLASVLSPYVNILNLCLKYYPSDELLFLADNSTDYLSDYECAFKAYCISDRPKDTEIEMYLSGHDEIMTTFAEVASAGGKGKQIVFDVLTRMLVAGKILSLSEEEMSVPDVPET